MYPIPRARMPLMALSATLSAALAAALCGPAAAQSTPAAPAAVPAPMSGPGPMAHGAHGAHGPRHGSPGVHPGGPGQRGGHHGPHHGGLGGPGGMGAGPMMLLMGPGQDRAFELVKATPEQRADIRRIAGAARDDLRAARQEARPRREAIVAAWTADRIDAQALEAERARTAARRDAAAKRMMQAMVDIGQVLQPAQRRQLAEHWSRGGAHRRADLLGLDDHAQAVVD